MPSGPMAFRTLILLSSFATCPDVQDQVVELESCMLGANSDGNEGNAEDPQGSDCKVSCLH